MSESLIERVTAELKQLAAEIAAINARPLQDVPDVELISQGGDADFNRPRRPGSSTRTKRRISGKRATQGLS